MLQIFLLTRTRVGKYASTRSRDDVLFSNFRKFDPTSIRKSNHQIGLLYTIIASFSSQHGEDIKPSMTFVTPVRRILSFRFTTFEYFEKQEDYRSNVWIIKHALKHLIIIISTFLSLLSVVRSSERRDSLILVCRRIVLCVLLYFGCDLSSSLFKLRRHT